MEKYIYDYHDKTQYLFTNPLDVITIIKDLTKNIKYHGQIADYIDMIYVHGLTILECLYVSKQVAKYLAEKEVSEARMQYLLEDKYREVKEYSKSLNSISLTDKI